MVSYIMKLIIRNLLKDSPPEMWFVAIARVAVGADEANGRPAAQRIRQLKE